MNHKQPYRYYQVGGPLSEDNLTYVEREADKDLCQALEAGEYCYVLNSRQMGKSSLVVRTRKKLEAQGFTFAYIDLTLVGTEDVSLDQWCTTLLSNLADSFQLDVDAVSWWKTHEGLAPLNRMTKFMETFLLVKQTSRRYIVVIDEIDTVLSLKKFRADDFFAFIRGCCIQRINKPEYQNLTFVLIGTATPSDLIADRDRTPFNLGRAISLYGFRLSEVHPLAKGMESCPVQNPQAVLEAILDWTSGQPFLTQKLCQLILEHQISIPAGEEATAIEQLVTTHIIHNWEGNDEPQHLRTIRDRIIRNIKRNNILEFKDEQHASNLLGLYQKILHHGKISADNSPEQEDLRLSGLVLKQDGVLTVYNRIYQQVFNQQWVQKELVKLRPYREQIHAWAESKQTDESRLLRGKALQDALVWAEDKQLGHEDWQFLESSRAIEQVSKAPPEISRILKSHLPQLQRLTTRLSVVLQEIQTWAGSQPFLTEQICQKLVQTLQAPIPPGEEAQQIESLVQANLIQDWQNQAAKSQLETIRQAILDHEQSTELLHLYQKILRHETVHIDTNPELKTLVELGLVENFDSKTQVANRIYASVFDQIWVEQELAKDRPVIHGRFEVLKEIQKGEYLQIYTVKEQHRSKQYVIKQLTPVADDSATIEETKRLVLSQLKEFGKINSPLIADFQPYFEEQKFSIVQEYIDGHNLDEPGEIQTGQRWSESQVTRLLIDILESLVPVHEQGLAHLNLKPANLRRRQQDGKIVPIDFAFLKAITALTAHPDQPLPPQHLGTPGYIPATESGDWSEIECDIYAIGIIGIQALTGIEPTQLPTDKQTGEVIWQFAQPDKPMAQVSPALEKILNKMVSHRSAARYTRASDIIQDLKSSRKAFSWLTDKRILAAGIAGLLLTNLLSFWWYQRSFAHQTTTQQTAVLSTQQTELIKQCHQPLRSQQGGNQNLITLDLITDARRVVDACARIGATGQTAQVKKSQGKALLLLWQSVLKLDQQQDARSFLNQAKQSFQTAIDLNPTDPQANFYLGLTKQLGRERYDREYSTAAKLYLSSSASKIDAEDQIILSKLAATFDRPVDFEQTDELYKKAIQVQPESSSPRFAASLLYNRGVLNASSQNKRSAENFLKAAANLAPNNQVIKDYLGKCLKQADLYQTPCQSPAALPKTLPVYRCKDYPVLAISETDQRKSLCQN